MMDFYREQILDHYRNPQNFGHLPQATVQWVEENVSCGDIIEMQAVVADGVVVAISFSGDSCAISTAAASLLTGHIKGKRIAEADKISREDMEQLVGITPTPTRLKCLLLPLEVLQKMLARC